MTERDSHQIVMGRYQAWWLVCCWLSAATAGSLRGSAGADAPAIDILRDLASTRVSELQHLLDKTNSKCPGCIEKGDYVQRCEQVWQELRRAPATLHVVGSEFDYLEESSEYEWVSGPYDVIEPSNSSWFDVQNWLRPSYKRRRCQADAAGSCTVLGYGTSPSWTEWTGWFIALMSEDEIYTYQSYHHATSNALLPQEISMPWKYVAWGSSKSRKSKTLKVLAGDAGRVAWEERQRSWRQRTDERGRNGLLRAACNGKPLDEARGCLIDGCPVDGRDDEGRTALMCAAELGNAPLVHVLLQAGANPKLEDSMEYRTARELAAEAGHQALASMLADRMTVGKSGGWSRGRAQPPRSWPWALSTCL